VIAVKWSKKEVETRPFLTWNRKGERVETGLDIEVYVYRFQDYRLEKELYSNNRTCYHLYKGNDILCIKNFGRYWFSSLKHATNFVSRYLENELQNDAVWVNPNKEYISNVFT
jgi:hypothetical protein